MIRDLLAIGLPTLTILVGILLNRNDACRLDARISALENRLDGRITGLESRLHARMMQVIGN